MQVSQYFKDLIWSFALTIATLACTTSFAHAQEARGRFTLPYEVHCGGATLPAGEYLYSFDLGNPTPVVVFRKLSPNAAGFLLVPSSSTEVRSGKADRLVIENFGGERVVTSMYMHDMGIVFRYSIPKSSKI